MTFLQAVSNEAGNKSGCSSTAAECPATASEKKEAAAGTAGQESSTTSVYRVGDRVSDLCGYRGTVRYVGPIDGYESGKNSSDQASESSDSTSNVQALRKEILWIGVEWDDPTRGKHDGTVNGKRYFSCSNNGTSSRKSDTTSDCCAGSFVKRHKLREPQDFKSAVIQRYTTKLTEEEVNNMLLCDARTNRTKSVEFVGRLQAEKHYAEIQLLQAMTFPPDIYAIGCVGAPPLLRLPNLVSLSLPHNLMSSWHQVAAVLSCMPQLRFLNLSGMRLTNDDDAVAVKEKVHQLQQQQQQLTVEEEEKPVLLLPELRELHLDETFLTWAQLLKFNEAAVNVRRLSLRGNAMTDAFFLPLFSNNNDSQSSSDCDKPNQNNRRWLFPKLESLDISDNELQHWNSLFCCIACFPLLHALAANNNKLSHLDQIAASAQRHHFKQQSTSKVEEVTAALVKNETEQRLTGVLADITAVRSKLLDPASSEEIPSLNVQPRPQLLELSVEGNALASWKTIVNMALLFPSLRRLVVQNNPFMYRQTQQQREDSFHTSNNNRSKKEIQETYATKPKLHMQPACRQLLIAVFGNLRVLNGAGISPAERCAAERYLLSKLKSMLQNQRLQHKNLQNSQSKKNAQYSSGSSSGFAADIGGFSLPFDLVASLQHRNMDDKVQSLKEDAADITSSYNSSLQSHPIVARLLASQGEVADDYFSLNEIDSTAAVSTMRGANSALAASLVEVTLQPDASTLFSRHSIKKNLAKTMQVGELKLLCARLFQLPLSRISLLYNDGHMPLSLPLDNDSCALDVFGISNGAVVRIQDLQDSNNSEGRSSSYCSSAATACCAADLEPHQWLSR